MRIEVNRATCMGMGACEALDPERFEVDGAGVLRILRPEVAPAEAEQAAEAVHACPTGSLLLDQGGA